MDEWLGTHEVCAHDHAASRPWFLLAAMEKAGRHHLGSSQQVRVILDYLPNAVHAGFYQAEAAGYFRDEGLNVQD